MKMIILYVQIVIMVPFFTKVNAMNAQMDAQNVNMMNLQEIPNVIRVLIDMH